MNKYKSALTKPGQQLINFLEEQKFIIVSILVQKCHH